MNAIEEVAGIDLGVSVQAEVALARLYATIYGDGADARAQV